MIQTNNPAILQELEREKEFMMRMALEENSNVEPEWYPFVTALVCGIFWYICLYVCAVTGNI